MSSSAAITEGVASGRDALSGLKIVRVIARLNIGGPARHATLLNASLNRLGCRTLLVYGTPGSSEGSLDDLVAAHRLRAQVVPELGRQVRPWSDLAALFKIVRVLFRERPDVVHTHTAKAGTLGRLAALAYNVTRRRRSRCLIVHTFHGHVFTGYFGRGGSMAVRVVERALALASDRIVAISDAQRDDLIREYRIASESRVEVIRLGLDLEALLSLPRSCPSAKSKFSVGTDELTIGYIGRFAPIKDLETLLRGFGLVARRLANVTLLLIGEGECRGRLQRLADALGVSARVRFTGWCTDLNLAHGAVDIAVISSRNEGTPVALIEAMAAGRPVVATRVGGVPDLVRHAENGLLVEAGSPEALSGALEELACDPARRVRFGDAGREFVRGRFTVTRLAADVGDLYARGLREKRGGGWR